MIKNISFIFCLSLVGCKLFAQKPAVYQNQDGAVGGYDVVAYFTIGKAVKGSDSLALQYNEARWKFSSQANLDSFRVNPRRFVPIYGGYCAYGVSRNYKAPTSADAWTIVNDRLYLNYNKDVQLAWKKEMDSRIVTADQNWPALMNK